MTNVIDDFNKLYDRLENEYALRFYLSCGNKSVNECTVKFLQERRSYFCCAVDPLDRCVLHKCLLVVFGTRLDLEFRANDPNRGQHLFGTFMIDGRNLSFPNIMMNNNILIHNFYDKLYSKSCKRMFLYGNVDEEKKINRAIQLVYDKHENKLFARDVYASDYVVTEDLNAILEMYLKNSGKWDVLNFIFDYDKLQSTNLVEQIKLIMATDINYSIDNLSNKIIYKHDYLLSLIYKPILENYALIRAPSENKLVATATAATTVTMASTTTRKKKVQTILYPKDCKKIIDTIVNGKLIYSVSKTFSKQKKNFINYQDNSSNNNIEINAPSLKYRIGNEVVRITNDTMRQDMLMQKYDFVKFIDSFFHGEMTVAGKKFFLCRDVRLPSVDYARIASKFQTLHAAKLIERVGGCDDDGGSNRLIIAFNNRPTIYTCRADRLLYIVYELKRNRFPVELKLTDNILFINHHEGMICIKKRLRITNGDESATISALLTPYEYHNSDSILRRMPAALVVEETPHVSQLLSKLLQYYYHDHLYMFASTPVPKLIVSVTNLKNAMPVLRYNAIQDESIFLDNLPMGNAVVVSPEIMRNDKMFRLWTLVRDNRLQTAEDPYIPDSKLPIRLYSNKINKIKGKLHYGKNDTPYVKYDKSPHYKRVEGDLILHAVGVVTSNVRITWIHDGKKYKIESCTSNNKKNYVFKIYLFFRSIDEQTVDRVDSKFTMTNNNVYIKLVTITSTGNLEGIKICGMHGQKGVLNGREDLTQWMAEDGTSAQICLSPISYLSRQSNFKDIETKYVVRGGDFSDPNAKRYPIFNIPYMFFNNTPDNIFKEFIKGNYTGHEKVEGTRLDQWTINQSFAGNRWSESLQCVRGGSNLPDNCGEYNVMSSLLHCNNTIIK
ncbi:LEF-8 [Alphabaculovirus myunipunctae]|uniref:DNA-directed RNA polymerase n=4 Tax=unclassified Alphabaculovirus TaxID=745176 RepID=A0A2K9VSF4_9ABAC|nr:LEF-8 [Mythimna unipuncta nucleopolyhedrovirus]AUV65387.1 LEF-8 [Mythimna unipuncta nucleopolyhedrovirus]